MRRAGYAALVGVVIGLLFAAFGFSALLEDRSSWPSATATFTSERNQGGQWLWTYTYVGPDGSPATFEDVSARSRSASDNPPMTIVVRWKPGQPGVREKAVSVLDEVFNGVMGLVVAGVSALVFVSFRRARVTGQ
jgi:hypothetical protein